jgi:hypothetical protein
MKTILRMLCVLSMLLAGTAWGKAVFNKEQIVKMAHVVLSVPENKEYKDILWDAQPHYDDKTATWRLGTGAPVLPGGRTYILEFVDADGSYSLGWATGVKSSGGFNKFRIQPSAKAKLTELMKSFRKP